MANFTVVTQHLPEETEKSQTVFLRIVSFQTENHIKGSQMLCSRARYSTVTFSGVDFQARNLTFFFRGIRLMGHEFCIRRCFQEYNACDQQGPTVA
jgi:hypothetical protein